ncbi:MAG: hypothetical protein ACR2G4_06985 [Pyrinomonadaceae bacterium]
MKFPIRVRDGATLLLIVSMLWLPVRAQRPAKPAPPPATSPARAQAIAAEKSSDVTFETLLSADAYGVYGEMHMVGQHIKSQEFAELLAPLGLARSAPQELLDLYAFLNAHAEPLMTARLMFAMLPARAGLPDTIAAVEMPSVEAAQKLAPELNQFIAAHFAPPPVSGEATLTMTPATATTAAAAAAAPTARSNRRRAKAKATRESERAGAKQPAAASPVLVKRAGNIIAMSNAPFTFKALHGTSGNLLINERGFQAARSRFNSDTVFVYLNIARIENSAKQRSEALEKEYRRQEELTRAQPQKQSAPAADNATGNANTTSANADMIAVGDIDGNANVAVVTNSNANPANANVAATGEPTKEEIPSPPPPLPEATPSPKSEKELEQERRREQSRGFTQALGQIAFGEGLMSNTSWPESIGVGASLDGDALVVRGLFVNASDEQPLRPIPFLPILLSGPSIASEAPTVLPADTDIFVGASLDLTQMYDYLASMIKLLDLAAPASGEPAKGTLSEQLDSFEKTNNFRIKEELLAALGNEIAIGLPAQWLGLRPPTRRVANASPTESPSASPASGPIIVISLNDKKSLQELLPRVLGAFGFAGANEQSIIEKRGEVELLTFSHGTLAFIDRFLVGAPDAATMRLITDAYNNGETLANSERFRRASGWQPRQALGQVYVSNAMLKTMFEDLTKSIDDIEDDATRNYLRRLDPDPGAITHLATREPNGLMHELRLPKNLLSLFTASTIIGQQLEPLRSNESMAQWRLRMINTAQNEYKESTGRYGAMEELKAAGHFQEEYESKEIEGYEIKLSASGDKFEATATPKSYPKLGRRSFYYDQTGTLRGGDLQGRPASASDNPID